MFDVIGADMLLVRALLLALLPYGQGVAICRWVAAVLVVMVSAGSSLSVVLLLIGFETHLLPGALSTSLAVCRDLGSLGLMSWTATGNARKEYAASPKAT